MILHTLLSKHVDLDTRRDECYAVCLSYVFGLMTVTSFNERIRTLYPDCRPIDIRRDLTSNGYLVKNIKLWLYQVVVSNVWCNGPAIQKLAARYRIRLQDQTLVSYLRTSDMLLDGLLAYKLKGHRSVTLEGFDHFFAQHFRQLHTYCMKFVHKKFKFLFHMEGYSAEDYTLTLLSSAVQGLLIQFPKVDTSLHALNIMKTCIHNTGINYIKSAVAGGRNMYDRNVDGTFSCRKVSYELLAIDNTGGKDDFKVTHQSGLDGRRDNALFLRMSINQLMERADKREKRLLRLLIGKENRKFTEFLRNEGVIDYSMSASDYFETLDTKQHNHYVRHAIKFSGFTAKDGRSYLESLRGALS